MKATTEKWVEFARADLIAAQLQFTHGEQRGHAYQIAVFHCHQAIEKMIKASLNEQGKEVIRTHDLVRLLELSALPAPAPIAEFIDRLNPHYLPPRYPDLPFQPLFTFTYNRENTEQIINQTNETLLWLEKQLTSKK